jgi:hypothetical protein
LTILTHVGIGTVPHALVLAA